MTARDDFVNRVQAIRHAVTNAEGLEVLQHQPAVPAKDEAARLFRNGLAVAGFAVLEDFLRSRTAEVLGDCSSCVLAFEDLPEPLQEFSMKGVVSALKFQVDMRSRSGEDVSGLIRRAGRALASTDSAGYELSELAFGRARSNLGHDDLKELLRAFRVKDAWGNCDRLGKRMGFSSLSLRDDFQSAAQRRHAAAHRGSVEIALGDLQILPGQVLAIAATFDALLSRSAFHLVSGDQGFARSGNLEEGAIGIRFLDDDKGSVREIGEGKKRAAAIGSSFAALLPACRARAVKSGAVIIYSEKKVPVAWEVTDLGPGRR
jgi:hypothetical protein